MNYLQKAVKELQPIYTTPRKVQQYVKKHKFDFLIKNPPYETNRQDNPHKRGLHGVNGKNA